MLNVVMVITVASMFYQRAETIPPNGAHRNVTEESKQSDSGQGYIVVAGGNSGSGYFSNCYAFDIDAGTWTALPDLPTGRLGGGLVTHQGMIYYVAGYGTGGLGLNNVLMLSTRRNKWIEGPPLQTISFDGVNALSVNDSLYALGGKTDSLERFSCSQGQFVWNEMPSTLQTHFYSGAAMLSGKIYICGAVWQTSTTFCQSYDPKTEQFQSIAPMNEARGYISMVALKGYLYVIGGTDANNERYDPISDEWKYFSHVPSQKRYQAAATDGRRIYVVGGSDYTDLVSMYIPELDIWESQTAYPKKIEQASITFAKTLP